MNKSTKRREARSLISGKMVIIIDNYDCWKKSAGIKIKNSYNNVSIKEDNDDR